jgi:ABC-type uncharacterized transport system YnjBCD ATPase subunit
MNQAATAQARANPEAGTLIKLEDLKKVFYTDEVETHALSGVHVEINEGDYVSIAGPSGCGKSTLLSILGLLDTPSGGRYLLNGEPVENLDHSQRAKIRNKEIGFVFQAFNLIGDLTVFENVELPLTYRTGLNAAERKQRVLEALERTGYATIPRSYRAASSSASPLPARSSVSRRSCSQTSRPATWIQRMARPSWRYCRIFTPKARRFAWSRMILVTQPMRIVRSTCSTAASSTRKRCIASAKKKTGALPSKRAADVPGRRKASNARDRFR